MDHPVEESVHMATSVVRQRRIIRNFLASGAISPETAKTPEEVGSFMGPGFMYKRLEARGVLKSAAGDRYYVDPVGLGQYMRRARYAVFPVFGAIIACALAAASESAAVPLYVMIPGLVVALALAVVGVVLLCRR